MFQFELFFFEIGLVTIAVIDEILGLSHLYLGDSIASDDFFCCTYLQDMGFEEFDFLVKMGDDQGFNDTQLNNACVIGRRGT